MTELKLKLFVLFVEAWTIDFLSHFIPDIYFQQMEQLPPGWIKEESNGRVIFFSPPPERLKIDCNATLKHYQRKGKLLEVSCLIFKRKTSVKKVGHTIVAIEDAQNENDEISKKDKKIKADADKMTWAVQQLTLDPLHPVDHKQELEEVARKLNKVRIQAVFFPAGLWVLPAGNL